MPSATWRTHSTINAAMASCETIIHIGPPMHPNEVEITSRFIDAALSHDISRFVYYSVMHPLRRAVRHHRLKLDAEEALIESGLPYTIVQPMRYMQHLALIWNKVLETGVHAMPFNIDVRFNVADLRDLAEATAIVATSPGHLYATYELAGPEALSQRRHGRRDQPGARQRNPCRSLKPGADGEERPRSRRQRRSSDTNASHEQALRPVRVP